MGSDVCYGVLLGLSNLCGNVDTCRVVRSLEIKVFFEVKKKDSLGVAKGEPEAEFGLKSQHRDCHTQQVSHGPSLGPGDLI